MRGKLLVLVLGLLLLLPPALGENIEGFLDLGLGLSFFHARGKLLDEKLPSVEFSFLKQTEIGGGITFAGIGVGLRWINFSSPFTEGASRRLLVLYLGGTSIGYFQSGEEKLFDLSFSSKRARLLDRRRYFLDLRVSTGFRYWRQRVDQPSLYQVYLSFALFPGVKVFSTGDSRVFVE